LRTLSYFRDRRGEFVEERPRGLGTVKRRKKTGYMISAVAENYQVHPQTLRLYERLGLLSPPRSDGNTRLYTEGDIERLETILSLTRDLGVNLAGVEVLLNRREKMEKMQKELEEIIAFVNESIEEAGRGAPREALVRVPPGNLIRTGARKK
jgi:MerR family transcriptional regulator/heat shock protein HspR